MNRKNNATAASGSRRGRNKTQNRTGRPARGRSIERPQPLSYAQTVGPARNTGLLPKFGNIPDRQPEIILQVVAGTEDSFTTVPIISDLRFDPASHPGLGGSAGYMARLGALHSQHRWHSLSFRWIPSCATVTPGNVVLKFLPNYQDPLPTQLVSLMDVSALTFSPYQSQTYTVKNLDRSIKNNTTAARFLAMDCEDKNDFSIGRLVIGTTKQVSAVALGLIEIVPNVEYFGPISGAN